MGHYSRWEDAMVAQARLLEESRTPAGARFLNYLQSALNAQHQPDQRMPEGFILEMQRQLLEHADPVYVSEDVRSVIDVARQSFKPEAARINDAFTQCGFALFPRPIILPDAPINNVVGVPVRAIGWMPVIDEDDPTRGCWWISYYTHVDDDVLVGRSDPNDPEERKTIEHLRRFSPLSLTHTFQLTFGNEPWKDSALIVRDEAGNIILDEDGNEVTITGMGAERRCPSCFAAVMHAHRDVCSLYRAGDEVLDEEAVACLSESAHERGMAQVNLIEVFWRIASQVFRGPERAPRGIWRDANRSGVRGKDVTVVRLRAYREARNVEPSGRTLSVQFIVRGHWHTYHTRNGPVQKWVMPFVKGPDGAPFKATDRVFEFVR